MTLRSVATWAVWWVCFGIGLALGIKAYEKVDARWKAIESRLSQLEAGRTTQVVAVQKRRTRR